MLKKNVLPVSRYTRIAGQVKVAYRVLVTQHPEIKNSHLNTFLQMLEADVCVVHAIVVCSLLLTHYQEVSSRPVGQLLIPSERKEFLLYVTNQGVLHLGTVFVFGKDRVGVVDMPRVWCTKACQVWQNLLLHRAEKIVKVAIFEEIPFAQSL